MFDPAKPDPACHTAVAALEHDPFYRSIAEEFASNVAKREAVLAQYFAYSIQEGAALGRRVHLPDPSSGVAVWLLPQSNAILAQAATEKRTFLRTTLGDRGADNYDRIIGFMSGKSAALISDDAWYLSIIAIDPVLQGRGLGRELLAVTLREADASNASSYLETFSPRNVRFYERLGFSTLARFDEPTTGADYAIMVRSPRVR